MLLKESRDDKKSLPVVFAIFQSGNRANGGVESITQVIEHLQNVQPLIVTQRETPVNDRWRAAGAEVHVWKKQPQGGNSGFGDRFRQGMSMLRWNARVAQFIHRRGASVMHCNDIEALYYAAFGAKVAGAAVAFNLRDTLEEERSYGLKWKLARQLSDRVVVLSKEMRDTIDRRLSALVGPSSPTNYVYSIVDFEEMHPVSDDVREELRKERRIRSGELALGYVATFNEKKAQLRFIERAAPRIKERIPRATVYFVGDFCPERDAYARRCEEAVRRIGLEDTVEFVGYAEDVTAWYQALDITLLASQREGMARCMIESLACGTPMVSFDVCSAREILQDHECGHVVPQGDHQALVQRIEALVGDRSELEQLGTNGERTTRELFDARRSTKQYEALYHEIA